MKKLFTGLLICLSVATLLTGCVGLTVGGGTTNKGVAPTVGQQLIDLQKAKDSGAINEAEYQSEKAKLLVKQ